MMVETLGVMTYSKFNIQQTLFILYIGNHKLNPVKVIYTDTCPFCAYQHFIELQSSRKRTKQTEGKYAGQVTSAQPQISTVQSLSITTQKLRVDLSPFCCIKLVPQTYVHIKPFLV